MFRFIAATICCLICSSVMSQTSLKNPSDSSILFFKWDIVRKGKGSLMYLDVPYKINGLNYISLTVAKAIKRNRPNFISIALPSNVNLQQGMVLSFIDNPTGSGNNPKIIKASFSETNKSTYIVRFIDGYLTDGKTDILGKFLQNKYLVLSFYSKNDKNKSVIVDLSNFKLQYQALP